MSRQILEPGSRLGKYEIVTHLAQGGMGDVYKAIDVELKRKVALKVLSGYLATIDVVLERFRREARAVAKLQHPNIVMLYECGHDARLDVHYLALEYVSGADLLKHLEQVGKLSPRNAQKVLVQATQALCHASEQGLVHRDIKPSNLLLSKKTGKLVVKLTDLGLARRADDDAEFRVTREGSTVGTIDYMAPEQARNSAEADIRSDIYSLGCTAYHMLAGKAPFAKGGLGERLAGHLEKPPPDLREINPRVSRSFWKIIQKMLAKKPEDRYATPHQLLSELQAMTAEHEDEEATTTVVDIGDSGVTTVLLDPEAEQAKPSEPAVAAPRKRRRKRKPAPAAPEAPTPQVVVTPEQAKAAASFHQHATEALLAGNNDEAYTRQLLINCLNLDPLNVAYRKTLRDMHRQTSGGLLSGLFGSINLLAMKSKLRLAKSVSNWRKVLELGEEILAGHANDLDTHLDMAEAARSLGAPKTAQWLLEMGLDHVPENPALMRALAAVHESQQNWQAAATFWERVRRADPSDAEAQRKISELLAREHVAETMRQRDEVARARRRTRSTGLDPHP